MFLIFSTFIAVFAIGSCDSTNKTKGCPFHYPEAQPDYPQLTLGEKNLHCISSCLSGRCSYDFDEERDPKCCHTRYGEYWPATQPTPYDDRHSYSDYGYEKPKKKISEGTRTIIIIGTVIVCIIMIVVGSYMRWKRYKRRNAAFDALAEAETSQLSAQGHVPVHHYPTASLEAPQSALPYPPQSALPYPPPSAPQSALPYPPPSAPQSALPYPPPSAPPPEGIPPPSYESACVDKTEKFNGLASYP